MCGRNDHVRRQHDGFLLPQSCCWAGSSLGAVRARQSPSALQHVKTYKFARKQRLTRPLLATTLQSVQTFGRKKTAVAVAYVKRGKGEIRLNGAPLDVIQPETLRWKVMEPILLLGKQRYSQVDIRLRVKGGGRVAQSYALRQAIAKGLVAFYQKYVDEQSKNEIKNILLSYDRSLIVADPRRCEPKKFGGKGARSRFQKSYR